MLRGIHDALRPDGTFLMVDIATSSRLEENLENPLAPFLFTVSTMHCMTVSLAEGGEGLGACWGEQKARELLAEAGFSSVNVKRARGGSAEFVLRVSEVAWPQAGQSHVVGGDRPHAALSRSPELVTRL